MNEKSSIDVEHRFFNVASFVFIHNFMLSASSFCIFQFHRGADASGQTRNYEYGDKPC
jgi:hypothetical protein